jgi:hypothetical protein
MTSKQWAAWVIANVVLLLAVLALWWLVTR